MGLFTKNEPCPVCGGEVKGLFLVKIGEKKTLCKECGGRVSMDAELLKNATPDFIKEHLTYRQKNAECYASTHWEAEFSDLPELKMGVSVSEKVLYLIHDKLHDEKNPVIFNFDQITGYELYRLTKKVDSAEDPGETCLDSGLTVLASIAHVVDSSSNSANNDYFKLKLTTTEPYWPAIELKLDFSPSRLHGIGGFGGQMGAACQVLKRAARKEPVELPEFPEILDTL